MKISKEAVMGSLLITTVTGIIILASLGLGAHNLTANALSYYYTTTSAEEHSVGGQLIGPVNTGVGVGVIAVAATAIAVAALAVIWKKKQ